MERGRVEKALDKVYRWDDGDYSLRQLIERFPQVSKAESDGMRNFNRARYNRMRSRDEQDAYEARLKARRYYYINGYEVPKIVYDAVNVMAPPPAGLAADD